jgi:hypothetical protein
LIRRSIRISGPLLVCGACILGLAVVAPFYLARGTSSPRNIQFAPISTHDMATHLAVMEQFDKVLRSGTLYPRWLPDFNSGYGAPWTNFYPPAFYYWTSLVNALTGNWMLTLFLVSGLGLALSGMAFYFASRDLFGHGPSLVAAAVYMLLPYHLLDLYWRGAFPEFIAFALIPPVFYFASRLRSGCRPVYFVLFAASYALLIVVHLPVALLMAYALAFYSVSRALIYKDLKQFFLIVSGMAVSYALSGIYLLPAVFESQYIYHPWTEIFPYNASYLKLFAPTDKFGELVNLSFIGCSLVIVVSVSVVACLGAIGPVKSRSKSFDPREVYLALAMGLVTAFMCTAWSRFIAELLPRIDVVSFCWRWLVIASFFAGLGLAAALHGLRTQLSASRGWIRVLAVSLGVIVVGVIGLNIWWSGRSIVSQAPSNPLFHQPDSYSDSGYTPKLSAPPDSLPANAPQAELRPGSGSVSVDEWLPSSRRITVSTTTDSVLRLRSYNFPGWTARLNGKSAELISDGLLAQALNFSPGSYAVEVTFRNTPVRTMGSAVSLAALLLLGGFAFRNVRARRRAVPTGTRPGDALRTDQ